MRIIIGTILWVSAMAACSSPPPVSGPNPDPAPVPPESNAVESSAVATTPAAPAPLVFSAEKQAGEYCPELMLQVERNGKLLAEKKWLDVCEDDPNNECGEDGGCRTTVYEHGEYVDLAGHRFVWVGDHDSWHDNGMKGLSLWGYECGRLAKVWSYSYGEGEESETSLTPISGDWRQLGAETITARWDGENSRTERFKLAWDDSECKFVEAE